MYLLVTKREKMYLFVRRLMLELKRTTTSIKFIKFTGRKSWNLVGTKSSLNEVRNK